MPRDQADLAILDAKLPGLNGVDLLRRLRRVRMPGRSNQNATFIHKTCYLIDMTISVIAEVAEGSHSTLHQLANSATPPGVQD